MFVLALACSDDKNTVSENNSTCRDLRCGIDLGTDTGTEDVSTGNCVAEGCEAGLLCNENTGACVSCQSDTECGGNAVCTDVGRCECAGGFHDCNGVCVSNTDVATCGSSCAPCDAPVNGTATCDGTSCGFTCDPPLEPFGDQCGACGSNADCSAGEPKCDNGLCVACGADSDCSAHAELPYCNAGACVECKSAEDCGGNICNTLTGACTTTMGGSVATCGECSASAECMTGHDCVPMQFGGAAHGNYCLPKKETECPSPYVVEITRPPVEGGQAVRYCGIAEINVTCEAVLDFGSLCPTGQNTECGKDGVEDGRCEPVGFDAILMCTYPCTTSTECLPSDELGCISGDYCGGF